MTMHGTQNTLRSSTGTGSYDRKLKYRALLEDLSTLGDEEGNNEECMEKTSNAVREAQSLLAQGDVEERVKHPGEGYLDSRVLRATSELAVRCSEAVSGNANVYDKHALAQYIRENPSWCEWTFPLEAPPLGILFGAWAGEPPAPRARAPRARHPRQELAQLSAPENVDKLEKTEEGSEMVSRVHRQLVREQRARAGPISYWHAVLDPGSFARTVENIYYISFLVRDGLVAVQLDEEYELPFITALSAQEQAQRQNAEENQFIVSLDMKRWQELIEAFDIKSPMMVLKRQ